MPELPGCCGINCAACPTQIATRTNDEVLRARTAAEWSKSSDHIFKTEELHCVGCTVEPGPHVAYYEASCEIRRCARSRKVETCAHCPDYGCATIAEFQKDMPEAKARLDAVRAACRTGNRKKEQCHE
jgi:hypothetical protein